MPVGLPFFQDSGKYIPSLVSDCYANIDEKDDVAWQEYLIKGTAASMYAAGSDTVGVFFFFLDPIRVSDCLGVDVVQYDLVYHRTAESP